MEQGWRRPTLITNKEIEKLRLNFSKRRNCDVAPLLSPVIPGMLLYKVLYRGDIVELSGVSLTLGSLRKP